MMQGFLKSFLENKTQFVAFLIMALVLAYLYFFSFSRHARVNIEIRSNVITNFQIYWAKSNESYDENRSSHVRINHVQTRYSLPIGDLKWIEKLRIDPTDGSRKTAKILIKRISIGQVGFKPIFIQPRSIRNRLKPVAGIMKTSKRSNGLLVVSSENDPQLELHIAPQKNRSFFGYWAPIGAAVLILFLILRWASATEENYTYIRYFLCFVFALIVVMAFTSRKNVHPDEFVHIRASKYYEDHWRPPEICAPETEHTYSVYGISRLNSMEIVYPISGKFSWMLSFLPLDPYLRLRLFNVFLFFLILLLCFRSTEFCIIASPLLVSPQIWYVFSYFNSDAFAMFFIFVLAYQILTPKSRLNRYLADDQKSRTLIWGILFGALFLILLFLKKNFYFNILFICFYFLWRLYYQYIKANKPVKSMVQKLGLIVLVIIIGYGLRLSLDVYYYGNNKKAQLLACREKLAKPMFKPSTNLEKKHLLLHLRDRGVTISEMISKYKWFRKSIRSAFGVYGYLTISAPKFYYRVAFTMIVVIFIFMIFSLLVNMPNKEKILFLIFLLCSILLLGTHLLRSWEIMLQPQGRYWLPIVGMVSVLFYHVREYLHPPVVHLYILFMFLLSSYSFIFVALVNSPKP